MNRRQFLFNAAAGLLASGLPRLALAAEPHRDADYTLVVEETPVSLVPGGQTAAFTFNGGVPAPVLRVVQGVPVRIAVVNRLREPTTIHWHGIRIDNAMDGVPALTQRPIAPGETFVYQFVCPDAGTFWYHPHFNSLEQLSKGLVGPLIVEEPQPPGFDAELVLGLKDWLLKPDGSYLPFTSKRHAARMGTLGNVPSINGVVSNARGDQGEPVIRYEVPAGGAVRLRVLNMDNTRVFHITLKDQVQAVVLATDGMPLAEPLPLDAYAIGPGMRIDIGFIAPAEAGRELLVYDRKGEFNFEMCRLRAVPAGAAPRARLPVLPANPVPEPVLEGAEKLSFVFEWEGALSPADAHGHSHGVFWTINRRAWDHSSEERVPEPLARLALGRSYLIELRNNTPHHHPIHLHGEIFRVLSSDKKAIHPHLADTVLLEGNETVVIALKASNPGKWMFHCHVIEHMKTGLMGYVEIA